MFFKQHFIFDIYFNNFMYKMQHAFIYEVINN